MIELFAGELRRAREQAQMTREQLAQRSAFSISLIEKVETGQRLPSEQFAEAMDAVLETGGLLSRIRQFAMTQKATPEWLRSWLDVEQQAERILCFELSFVPGLLQTEEYARELLHGDEAKLAARMERQSVLERGTSYVALIDERSLRYPVGDPSIMAKQLRAPDHRYRALRHPGHSVWLRHVPTPRWVVLPGYSERARIRLHRLRGTGRALRQCRADSPDQGAMGPDPSRSAVEEAVDRTDAGGSGRMEQQSLRWRKSTKSNTHGACVEVAFEGDRVYVRDSKDRQGPVLRFTQKEWDAFLDGARKGEFDL